ncbi:hypothetical protein QBC41DRAFT_303568 [Cercophora samala]|uniref:Uncharacterized protein n=1 Tax=Cercophora samala TaxID=330535 RepID=A0AA39ZD70_9PEZI|nr:hypothetical protein QBC41DRAFT_303568 [Cercophora samala]
MVRISTCLASGLTITGVLSQTSLDAQYVLDSIATLQGYATRLGAESQALNTLSCPLYVIGQGPFTKVIPVVKELEGELLIAGPKINTFRPLNETIPADLVTAQDITRVIRPASLTLLRAFNIIAGVGKVNNACSLLPLVGEPVATAFGKLKVAMVNYYLAVLLYEVPQEDGVGLLRELIEVQINTVIQSYGGVVSL